MNYGTGSSPPTLDRVPPTRHLGSSRPARSSAASHERKAALTLDLEGIHCLLGIESTPFIGHSRTSYNGQHQLIQGATTEAVVNILT